MNCTECETPVEATTLVTFTTGKTEELPLCAECREAYREGAFVSEVTKEPHDTGGEVLTPRKCADCGEITLLK